LNLKTAKHLRKMAHTMCMQPDGSVLPTRQLIVNPAHQRRFEAEGVRHVSAVNEPRSWRGIYRWLKRHYRNA